MCPYVHNSVTIIMVNLDTSTMSLLTLKYVCIPVSLYLSIYLTFYLFLSLSFYLPIFLLSLSIYVFLSLSLSTFYLFLSIYIFSLSLSLYLSPFHSLSFTLSRSLTKSLILQNPQITHLQTSPTNLYKRLQQLCN